MKSYLDAVNLNKDVVSAESYISLPVHEQLKLPPEVGVFATSFFSHMPETTWEHWLKALANALAPRGVLIFTTHGFVLDKQGIIPGLGVKAKADLTRQSEQYDLEGEQDGLTISYSRRVLPVLAPMPELRLSKFTQGALVGTEDTCVSVKEPDRLPGRSASALNHPTTPASDVSKKYRA